MGSRCWGLGFGRKKLKVLSEVEGLIADSKRAERQMNRKRTRVKSTRLIRFWAS